jgi:BirA family biotin operon repressor/biotin-[acetyl-CoA-carboxylase] ligase
MQAVSAALHAQALLHGLTGLKLGHPIYLYQQIGSTSDEARRLADGVGPDGLMVVAEQQTAGRGRAGRHWITPPGSALAFSLVLRPRVPAQQGVRLTMIAGLAVLEAVEQVAGVPAALKWPNDILVNGQKAGGILVEAATAQAGEAAGDALLDYVIVGIGLNVDEAPGAAEVDFPATALAVQAGRPVDRVRLLRSILQRMEVRYPAGLTSDPAALYADWAARLAWLGKPVVARTPAGEIAGEAVGTDPDGALVVRLDSGERVRVLAGDVRLRLSES